MSPQAVGILGLVFMLGLMALRMNIGLSMAFAGFFGYIYLSGIDNAFAMLGMTPYGTITSYSMTALPLFVFMGAIVTNTGIGENLYTTAYKWFGQLRGGLATATIAACALFAAICGSSAAETLTIGKIASPEMKRYNYEDSLATGSIAAGGTLGVLIPPSMAFILYGLITEQSVGQLFMAGILPGILLTILFMLVIAIWTVRYPKSGPAGPKTSIRDKVVSLKYTWSTVLLFLLVLGGIYLGIFTPTEAGAIGAFGAILVTFFSRRLTIKNLLTSILEAGTTTAMFLTIIIGAFIFMRFLTVSKTPFALAGFISSLNLSPYGIWAAIVVLYIFLGMFLETASMVVLSIPLIYPVVIALGFDPIWFGVQVVILMEMGMVTPPVGLNVFLFATITDVPMKTIFRGVTPFVGAMLICITILTIWPQIALFLPNTMR